MKWNNSFTDIQYIVPPSINIIVSPIGYGPAGGYDLGQKEERRTMYNIIVFEAVA